MSTIVTHSPTALKCSRFLFEKNNEEYLSSGDLFRCILYNITDYYNKNYDSVIETDHINLCINKNAIQVLYHIICNIRDITLKNKLCKYTITRAIQIDNIKLFKLLIHYYDDLDCFNAFEYDAEIIFNYMITRNYKWGKLKSSPKLIHDLIKQRVSLYSCTSVKMLKHAIYYGLPYDHEHCEYIDLDIKYINVDKIPEYTLDPKCKKCAGILNKYKKSVMPILSQLTIDDTANLIMDFI